MLNRKRHKLPPRIDRGALAIKNPATRKRGERSGDIPSHRKWVAKHICLCASDRQCSGQVRAHHERRGTGGGTARKPHDKWCVPLCDHHHQEGHNTKKGWNAFEEKHGIDIKAAAEALWAKSPYRRNE